MKRPAKGTWTNRINGDVVTVYGYTLGSKRYGRPPVVQYFYHAQPFNEYGNPMSFEQAEGFADFLARFKKPN